MTPADDIQLAAAKIESALIGALHRHGQIHVAKAAGLQESAVSEAKCRQIPLVAKLIAACGLKLVGEDRVCVKREEWALMTRIVSRALVNERSAMELLFEETE